MKTSTPWEVTLSGAQHDIILFFLVLTGFALFAQSLRGIYHGSAVSARYKAAATAGLTVTGVAFMSYVIIIAAFAFGYTEHNGMWVPNSTAEWSYTARYAEWAVSVPLLLVQLFTVAGASKHKNFLQAVSMLSAFIMVLCGYIGGVAIDGGRDLGSMWFWGLISTFFFIVVYVVVVYTTIDTMPQLNEEGKVTFRNAMVLLLVTWMIYPAIFGLQGFTAGGEWTTVAQITLCCADVAAKVAFGTLLFHLARQRTQDDRKTTTETLIRARGGAPTIAIESSSST